MSPTNRPILSFHSHLHHLIKWFQLSTHTNVNYVLRFRKRIRLLIINKNLDYIMTTCTYIFTVSTFVYHQPGQHSSHSYLP
ncbi:hypothetical protein L2E82_03782 [Cichorium intybus]|uniref:Uncharacterized protein n=1 Tax=Cichorium intybus TaxID=13427 RepID=A0ACB9H520_CICIN|nr:hypothetical protein L2E82_03782 [Cichorium intybus]